MRSVPLIITEAIRYEIPKFLKFAVPYSLGISVLNVIPLRAYDIVEISPESANSIFTNGFHFSTLLEHYHNTKDLIFLSTMELDQFGTLTAARMALNITGLISTAVFVGLPYYVVTVNSIDFKNKSFAYFPLKTLWSTLAAAFLWGSCRCITDRYLVWKERKERMRHIEF